MKNIFKRLIARISKFWSTVFKYDVDIVINKSDDDNSDVNIYIDGQDINKGGK